MAYEFEITESRNGKSMDSDGVSCSLEFKYHEQLFKALDSQPPNYPHLDRFRNHYEDGFVGHESVEELIAEVELASSQFADNSPFKPFLDSFHSLCRLAFAREGSISAFCD